MPLLRSLTTKLKTKLTISPPASPTTSPSGSTSSFEVLGGERRTGSQGHTQTQTQNREAASSVESLEQKRPQSRRANTGSSEMSFGCVGIGAAGEDRRRSKFREEF